MHQLARIFSAMAVTFTIVFVRIEVQSVNVTLISLTTENEGREGFLIANPVYDVILRRIKNSNPVLFANFTHIALQYIPSESNSTAAKQSDQEFQRHDDAVNIFFRFFFQNGHLFSGNLSEQFTIITTPGEKYPKI
jgi:hypothetical protein